MNADLVQIKNMLKQSLENQITILEILNDLNHARYCRSIENRIIATQEVLKGLLH